MKLAVHVHAIEEVRVKNFSWFSSVQFLGEGGEITFFTGEREGPSKEKLAELMESAARALREGKDLG